MMLKQLSAEDQTTDLAAEEDAEALRRTKKASCYNSSVS